MSRIGKQPIALPGGVKVSITGSDVFVEGPKHRLHYSHRPEVTVQVDAQANRVVVSRKDDSRKARAMHGLTRALIANMIIGVSKGFSKELEINGVGWTAKLSGKNIELNVGYADTRVVPLPDMITVNVNGNRITVTGPDKQAVGQVAAQIRAQRKPEPYNGKGIKYVDEHIVRKQGKAFVSGSA